MRINILGTGITKFGELWDKSLLELALDASADALKNSGLKNSEIDAVIVSNMIYSKSGQDHLGALIASSLGIKSASSHVEAACASGGVAIHQAVTGILSGLYQNILVVGTEKMTDLSGNEVTTALMGAASLEERQAGLTFPALYALMAKSHMKNFGTTKKHLASVAVKNHFHASLNPKAQFPFEISEEKVLSSTMIADPLSLFDSSPISDGAAAIILSGTKKSNVFISASSVSTDSVGLSERESLTEISATKRASNIAFNLASLGQKDIDLLEVHDCFTIAEILAMEDLGFCKKGDGGEFIQSGTTKLGGKLPVNTSGGLKGCGHPVGATGVKQVIEVYEQLKGAAGKRQINNAKVGLTQNVGGTGATVAIHIIQI
jgi:acetyl-CoA C-acetyltransferase